MAKALKPSNYLLCRHGAGRHPGARLRGTGWRGHRAGGWGAAPRLAACCQGERETLSPGAPQTPFLQAMLQSCWGASEMPSPQNSLPGRWCGPHRCRLHSCRSSLWPTPKVKQRGIDFCNNVKNRLGGMLSAPSEGS